MQNPHTGGMKRTDPDTLRALTHNPVHSFSHLTGRLVRKCDGKNIPRVHLALLNQMGNPISQYPGLSRTGARKNQQRPLRVQHCFLLFFI